MGALRLAKVLKKDVRPADSAGTAVCEFRSGGQLGSLTFLSVQGNMIGDVAAEELIKAIPETQVSCPAPLAQLLRADCTYCLLCVILRCVVLTVLG